MDIAKAMNYKELHLHLLRLLYQEKRGISPKELIARFAANYAMAYTPFYIKEKEHKITDAKIYAAIKFLEKEQLIERELPAPSESPRAPPRYRLSQQGRGIIKQTMSLTVQNFQSFIIMTFFRRNHQKLRQLGLTSQSVLGLVGPRAPLGFTILGFFTQHIDPDPLQISIPPIYFIDFDQILLDLRVQDQSTVEVPYKRVELSFNKNVIFRSCYLDENRSVRMDIGNNQLDFIITITLFSNFPQDYETTLKEVWRVLKPGGIAVFQEFSIKDSFLLWILQMFTQEEVEILSDFFFNLLSQEKQAGTLNISDLAQKIEEIFGKLIEVEDFREVNLLYAQKVIKD